MSGRYILPNSFKHWASLLFSQVVQNQQLQFLVLEAKNSLRCVSENKKKQTVNRFIEYPPPSPQAVNISSTATAGLPIYIQQS